MFVLSLFFKWLELKIIYTDFLNEFFLSQVSSLGRIYQKNQHFSWKLSSQVSQLVRWQTTQPQNLNRQLVTVLDMNKHLLWRDVVSAHAWHEHNTNTHWHMRELPMEMAFSCLCCQSCLLSDSLMICPSLSFCYLTALFCLSFCLMHYQLYLSVNRSSFFKPVYCMYSPFSASIMTVFKSNQETVKHSMLMRLWL